MLKPQSFLLLAALLSSVPASVAVEAIATASAEDELVRETRRALKRAPSINLSEVVAQPDAVNGAAAQPQLATDSDPLGGSPLLMLDSIVQPGTATRLSWSPGETFSGIAVPTPVLVVNGAQPGPTLCLTAAVHGDELNGIEIVRRILYETDPKTLNGALVGVPIVNLQGFHRGSRYLADRRDLNRYFPGNPNGSAASRIAYSLFNEVILHCNVLVDLHTGSFHRTNITQMRADLTDPRVLELSHGFGDLMILHHRGGKGTLRNAAARHGVPAVTLEAGQPMRLEPEHVELGVRSLRNVMVDLGMIKKFRLWTTSEPVYYKSRWVRASAGGILMSKVKPGDPVSVGTVLGTITDPITNAQVTVVSPTKGRVLGLALNQVVMPGFATHHLGIEATQDEVTQPLPALKNGNGEEIDTEQDTMLDDA